MHFGVDVLYHLCNCVRCYDALEWMNCQEKVDPSASWKESWRALERQYAEGRALSIGVSNFGLEQLQELELFANVRPHVVQNFAEPGKIDFAIIDYCKNRNIQFMSYSNLRGRKELSPKLREAISKAAIAHRKTEESVILRSFVQSGVVVIPRSGDVVHMLSNQQIFNWDLTDEEMKSVGW